MKRMNFYFSIAAAMVSLSLLPSCLDEDDYYNWPELYPNAMVTVKTADDGRMYLQLDDQTTLLPTNMTSSPFGDKEVRAFTNFDYRTEKSDGYDKVVQINWLDSILTKSTAPFPAGDNDDLYGADPVEIADDWITVVEDGYLTLHLRAAWRDPKVRHRLNLITGGNPDDPYEVELRHDAAGDATYDAMMADAYVAFRLDKLPDTEGKTVKLTLKWLSPRGERSAQFDYRTRNFASSPATEE